MSTPPDLSSAAFLGRNQPITTAFCWLTATCQYWTFWAPVTRRPGYTACYWATTASYVESTTDAWWRGGMTSRTFHTRSCTPLSRPSTKVRSCTLAQTNSVTFPCLCRTHAAWVSEPVSSPHIKWNSARLTGCWRRCPCDCRGLCRKKISEHWHSHTSRLYNGQPSSFQPRCEPVNLFTIFGAWKLHSVAAVWRWFR